MNSCARMWMLDVNCVLWVDRLCSTVLESVCMRVLLANKCLCGWVGVYARHKES